MIRAASLDIGINLKSFSEQLRRLGLAHRIVEESGQQVIWTQTESEAELLRQALNQWQRGDQAQISRPAGAEVAPASSPRTSRFPARIATALAGSPVTWFLISVSAAVAVISGLGSDIYPVRSLFYPLLPAEGLVPLLAALDRPAEFLRTLTPMFLHFGELHLVFNMLWLWYFGKQLESLQTKWVFLVLVLSTAFISNTAQYLAQGYNNFGGMSGVVYGLLGYTWIIHYAMPRSHLLINNSMFVFFVIALVVMEVVAGSLIATAAHVAGLVAGLLIGVAMVLYYRLVLLRSVVGRHGSAGNRGQH